MNSYTCLKSYTNRQLTSISNGTLGNFSQFFPTPKYFTTEETAPNVTYSNREWEQEFYTGIARKKYETMIVSEINQVTECFVTTWKTIISISVGYWREILIYLVFINVNNAKY